MRLLVIGDDSPPGRKSESVPYRFAPREHVSPPCELPYETNRGCWTTCHSMARTGSQNYLTDYARHEIVYAAPARNACRTARACRDDPGPLPPIAIVNPL